MTLELVAEVLALVSAAVLWIPAYRLGKELLIASRIRSPETHREPSRFERFGERVRQAILEGQQSWDWKDHLCLMAGLAFMIISTALKILVIILRPTPS
jgi:hypothetical protein